MTSVETACGACASGVAAPEFVMAFQPIVDIEARRIAGYEALVRGPAGEPAGTVLSRITAENRYVFDQACRVQAITQAAALGLDRKLSINFLPNAVYSPAACIRATLAAARTARFPLDLITFEITEDERITDTAHLQGIITEYRAHGFRVALDDFGADFAGPSRLAALDVDAVKLDRSMIQDIDRNTRQRVITLGLIGICRDLGIDVVAEGVERRAELDVLAGAGVRYVQGFLFAKPAVNRLAGDAEALAVLES